jgi:hypothetical protein
MHLNAWRGGKFASIFAVIARMSRSVVEELFEMDFYQGDRTRPCVVPDGAIPPDKLVTLQQLDVAIDVLEFGPVVGEVNTLKPFGQA